MNGSTSSAGVVRRRRWRVRGQIQGVGFRPFVYRLAQRYGLAGAVRNTSAGVVIEAQGSAQALGEFGQALQGERPPLGSIASISSEPLPPLPGESKFCIDESVSDGTPSAAVTVDTALCADCRAELLDPTDRRHGHALINCTNCGPRYSIVRRVPYDRPNTTMAGFAMCPACEAEYGDVGDRRFHAQPIACRQCGPRIDLVDSGGPKSKAQSPEPLEEAAIGEAARRLAAGQIVAIKGLGGFHLAVRADSEEAVARLRRLKARDAKPFALMCPSLAAAGELVDLSPEAAALLESPACPIVLAPRRAGAKVAPSVAPGSHRLGVMLPYTPIHHLLFAAEDANLGPLVMTSGNRADEPLAIDNDEAWERLGPLCDAFLWHDRPIERCVDDSIVLDASGQAPGIAGGLLPIRRARGNAPAPLRLPCEAPREGLCVGGELKNTIAIVRGGDAILSQHLGDLKHPSAFAHFRKAIDDLIDLFGTKPQWIAHDLHPAYLSTLYARQLAARWSVPLIGVQHHHAHAAAVMAESGRAPNDPVLAVVCDGTGYGPDGTIWGGELLRADLLGYERLAHLKPLRLPGGDAAAKDTRRCALALLYSALGDDFEQHLETRRLVPDVTDRRILCGLIRRGVSCAISTGAGRVFDGVAALLGLCDYNEFEAQAALALEAAAHGALVGQPQSMLPGQWRPEGDGLFALGEVAGARQIDLSPLIRRIVALKADDRATVDELAALFHSQLAQAWEAAVVEAAERTGIRDVALSGGVFCNQILTQDLSHRLELHGYHVLRHQVVPANDGGLALGQAAIASALLAAGKEGAPLRTIQGATRS